jgi:hypothetical protein
MGVFSGQNRGMKVEVHEAIYLLSRSFIVVLRIH